MNTSATFSLAIMLSAINRTGGAFGAVEQQAAGLQRSFSKTKDAANKLFNIGSAVGVGLGGWCGLGRLVH